MCKAKVFLPERMTRPARVACRPFEQAEVYPEQSVGEAEMRALLRCQVRCCVQSLCPFKLPSPLVWQRSSIEILSVVLRDSTFDHCEVLGSVTVAVENCQHAWGGVGIIKAGMLAVCLTWCSVSSCLPDVCVFQEGRVALQAGGGHLGRGCVAFERFFSGQGRQTYQLEACLYVAGKVA